MKCLILAGGYATRLWPLTERRAKPLLPLVGKPLLTHIVENIPAGIEITVSTNAVFASSIRAWQLTLGRKVEVIIEHTKSDHDKVGLLGAFSQWLTDSNVQEDVLFLAGDNYLGFKLSDFIARYTPGVPLLAVREIGDRKAASAFGTIVLAPDHRTIALYEEKPTEPKSSLVSTTCAVVPPSVFPIIHECALTHPDKNVMWEGFLRQGVRCEAFPFTESWFDVGSFESYLTATTTLVGERLHQGVSATIEETVTSGSVVVGERCTVSRSDLRDTILFDGCIVEDCVLDRCILDSGCRLKGVDLSGKMLRAGTVLERQH